ncbi:MAG: hypothetical protein LBR92_02835 [Puniceicoccales bacterium]|jgi:hypothetical protein|nr:hypothetical protein [Puniceicoccales bacterium]
MKKDKKSVWFWLIAIAIMVFAMCVLSLQIIDLHQKNSLKKCKVHAAVPVASIEETVEKKEGDKEPKKNAAPIDQRPRAIPSVEMRTPKFMQEFDRILYDVPHDGRCGFWAILRGLNPDDELIRLDEVMELKRLAAKCAAKTELGPSRQEIARMFGGNEWLSSHALPYVAHALKRDVIVSSSDKNFGYDLFTEDGEVFHYASIDEIHKEASSGRTIWLHNIDNVHWTVAIREKRKVEVNENGEVLSVQEKPLTYFIATP